jgi:hypothetical protein
MLDSDAKPWLLEVNLDPALKTDSPLDLRIKSNMLVDLLNIIAVPIPAAQVCAPRGELYSAGAAAGGRCLWAVVGMRAQLLLVGGSWRAALQSTTQAAVSTNMTMN